MGGDRHVVILGGGFGGLATAAALETAPLSVTVIDRRNHHLFQPLLYQVATAALNPSDIAKPIRAILRDQRNARVILGDADTVDLDGKRVRLRDGESIPYDDLVVATGARHAYFGNDHWERHAPGLKTIEDALEIRRRVLIAYEEAERETDPALQAEWLTFVVVGAGPTGVEMAGSLVEIARHALARDFRAVDPTRARVILLEGLDRVLPPYPPELSGKAAAQLRRLGVTVRTGTRVTSIDARGVDLGDERIPARTVIWAAGVAASPLGRALGGETDRAGRVIVEADLTLPGRSDVYVIGDLASVKLDDGAPVPGVAPAAAQMGRHVASCIRRRQAGQATTAFRYADKGSLATIGRRSAVADLGRIKLSGFSAWIAWLAIHVFFLIGFRNRILVLLQWVWSYMTYGRGARLITGGPPEDISEEAGPARVEGGRPGPL